MNVAEKDYWICFRTPESSQTTRRACRELLRGQPSSKGSAVSRDWSQTGKGPIDASHSGTVSFRLRRNTSLGFGKRLAIYEDLWSGRMQRMLNTLCFSTRFQGWVLMVR